MVSKFYTIKELSESDRPREKSREFGMSSLTDKELLAIILRTGTKNINVLELSENILTNVGSIKKLSQATYNELISYKGIGNVKAIDILASVEFAKRIYKEEAPNKVICTHPEIVANYLRRELEILYQEVFIVLDLDTKGKIIDKREVFKGSLSSSVIHPREIFKNSIKNSASSIICVHNHPSGDPTPSFEDIITTINLIRSGEVLGIEVLDHIVVGKLGYASIRMIFNYFDSEGSNVMSEMPTRDKLKKIIERYKIINEY